MNRAHARVLGVLVAGLLLVPVPARAADDVEIERRIAPRGWMTMLELGVLRVPLEDGAYETRFDYEGLVAVLRTTGGLSNFRGFIIDARWMPPPPENVSTD